VINPGGEKPDVHVQLPDGTTMHGETDAFGPDILPEMIVPNEPQ
jgi:hypothetical protein